MDIFISHSAKKLGYGHGVGHLDGGHSGRYQWGTGKVPFQHATDFFSSYQRELASGRTPKEIADGYGMSIKELRSRISIARDEIKIEQVANIMRLKEEGYNDTEIAKKLGMAGESSVRDAVKPERMERRGASAITADIIREAVEKHKYIDVGTGNEQALGITETTLDNAIERLKMEGYEYYNNIKVTQLGTNKQTTLKVIAKPGIEWGEVTKNRFDIQSISDYDNGDKKVTKLGIEPPTSLDSKRIMVRYAEDGGTEKDGTIEIRKGLDDISLGNSNYAQVRIAVDGSHFIKGMAVYSDMEGIPKKYDVVVNSNKPKGTPLCGDDNTKSVLKLLKENPENPFGATITAQMKYVDKDGKEKLGVINKVNDEGTWAGWSRTVASQMLGKQPLKLIKNQLDLTYAEMNAEFDLIKNIQNPTIKRKLLEGFADECDTKAVNLKAVAFPRQTQNVLLPLTTLKNNEIYAPQYKDGETVALIRYPHGGLFEIPILKVNNKNKEGRSNLGKPLDAVGISPYVAEILSGADFDGDTATVIPCNSKYSKIKIENMKPLKDMEGFNPKKEYPYREGMKVMSKQQTQKEMGKISNLITDMTIKGATEPELARAVKHSMVVIDAAKHKLDYRLSEKVNRIDELRKTYQKHQDDDGYGGASTLLSRAKREVEVPERKASPPGIGENGEKIFRYTNRTYKDPKTGETKLAMEKVKKCMKQKMRLVYLQVLLKKMRMPALLIRPKP